MTLLAALAASATVAGTASAQSATVRSPNTGLTLGLGLVGASLSTSSGNRSVSENGGGLNFEIGWGFTPKVTVFLAATGAGFESDVDYAVGQADLGVRYIFRATDKKARPYVEAGLSARQLNFDFATGANTVEIKSTSGGVLLGGGVQIFFHPRVALDIGANVAPGTFSDWKADDEDVTAPDIEATSTNLRIGVRFWPMGR